MSRSTDDHQAAARRKTFGKGPRKTAGVRPWCRTPGSEGSDGAPCDDDSDARLQDAFRLTTTADAGTTAEPDPACP